MVISIIIFSMLSFILGMLVSLVSCMFTVKSNFNLIDEVDKLLPQMQCAQCGYPGCYAYSNAIINQNESIHKCLPGGKDTIIKLKNLLNNEQDNIDVIQSFEENIKYNIVDIDDNNCVGCSKCRLVCPVDAIVGTYNFKHTVLKEFCTGCNLCISVCPTNCITEKTIFYEE